MKQLTLTDCMPSGPIFTNRFARQEMAASLFELLCTFTDPECPIHRSVMEVYEGMMKLSDTPHEQMLESLQQIGAAATEVIWLTDKGTPARSAAGTLLSHISTLQRRTCGDLRISGHDEYCERVRVNISFRTSVMVTAGQDGGEFERKFPTAILREGRQWSRANMTLADAKEFARSIIDCPAALGNTTSREAARCVEEHENIMAAINPSVAAQ
jgi:hypothetical protein